MGAGDFGIQQTPFTLAYYISSNEAVEKSLGVHATRLVLQAHNAVGRGLYLLFGVLRSGEATIPSLSAYDPDVHLSVADVSLDSTPLNAVIIRIKASKTDCFQSAISLYLGKTKNDLCPVSALSLFMA